MLFKIIILFYILFTQITALEREALDQDLAAIEHYAAGDFHNAVIAYQKAAKLYLDIGDNSQAKQMLRGAKLAQRQIKLEHYANKKHREAMVAYHMTKDQERPSNDPSSNIFDNIVDKYDGPAAILQLK